MYTQQHLIFLFVIIRFFLEMSANRFENHTIKDDENIFSPFIPIPADQIVITERVFFSPCDLFVQEWLFVRRVMACAIYFHTV